MRRALTLAALLSAGCIEQPIALTPAVPTLTSATLYAGATQARTTWVGLPGTIRIIGRDLRDPTDPAAPVHLTAMRTHDLLGRTVTGPELAADVALTGPAGTETAAFDVSASALVEGAWRMTVSDRRGLVAEEEEAFLVLPRPLVTGVEPQGLCQAPPGRTVVLTGIDLPDALLWDPALVAPGGAIRLYSSVRTDACRVVGHGSLSASLCTSVYLSIPDSALTASGMLTLRGSGAAALLPEAERSAPFTMEIPGWGGPSGQTLTVLDGPGELLVWQGTPALVRAGGGPTVELGGVPLQVRAEGCAPTFEPGVQRCDRLYASVPQGFPPGSHVATTTTEAGCTTSTPLTVVPRPALTGLDPPFVCRRTQRGLTLLGSGLAGTTPQLSAGGTGTWTSFNPNQLDLLPVGAHLVTALQAASTPTVRSEPVPLEVFPGPAFVSERVWPEVVFSGATRTVQFWPSSYQGPLTARLLPASGGAPIEVETTEQDGTVTFVFPALEGDESYTLEVSDASPCSSATTLHKLWTVSDPVLLSWDFESVDQLPYASDAAGSRLVVPALDLTPGAGVAGAAAVGSTDADVGDWYFTWYLYGVPGLPHADRGVLSFDLKAAGVGAPSTAPAIELQVSDYLYGHGTLRRALPPPAPGAWTHYDLRLDDPAGWTITTPLGVERPPTRFELDAPIVRIRILGSWWQGPGDAAVDNLTLELAR